MNCTNGEWKIKGEDVVSDEFVSWIAKINMDCYKFKHNADLIAAAPDMYVILKALQQGLQTGRERLGFGLESRLNDAIAKADGNKKEEVEK